MSKLFIGALAWEFMGEPRLWLEMLMHLKGGRRVYKCLLELFYRYHKLLISLGYYEAKALGYMLHRLCDLLQRLY